MSPRLRKFKFLQQFCELGSLQYGNFASNIPPPFFLISQYLTRNRLCEFCINSGRLTLCCGAKYFRHTDSIFPLTYKNVRHFRCTQQKETDNSEIYRSHQTANPQNGTLFVSPFQPLEFREGFSRFLENMWILVILFVET